MRTRLIRLWDFLRSSYWFLPLSMSVGAVLLAELFLALDRATPDALIERGPLSRFVYVAPAESQRTLLLTIATTTLGTAGVVFSLTTVPLTVAAAQFGSRLLRNYLRSTTTQGVLGAYFSTFTYCVVVLFTLPVGEAVEGARNLPHLSTTVSLLLAVVTFCSLIFFIHHVGTSLQAPVVIDGVGDEIEGAISYYESVLGGAPALANRDEAALGRLAGRVKDEGTEIAEVETGYVDAIDVSGLVAAARQADAVLYLLKHPGDFVGAGAPVALVWPPERATPELADAVRAACLMSNKRTLTQDIEFGINSLVEIAVRAMSPAINDPFTAMNCLDRLGAVLGRIACDCRPWSYRFDDAGNLRLIYDPVTFPRLADAAYHLIRQYSRGNAEVLIRMLDSIESVLPLLSSRGGGPDVAADRAALRMHADLVAAEAGDGGALPNPYDRERVRRRHAEVIASLERAARPAA